MKTLQDLESLFQSVEKEAIEDWKTFLRFESISTGSHHKKELLACCNWLSDYIRTKGLAVEVWETEGEPTIFASYDGAGSDKPTVLFYGHYDVQPVDPLDKWKSPPFEPTLKDGNMYARGAQDNKGQIFYTTLAVTTLLKEMGSLPVNVKLLIEGEEEIGSPNLSPLLHAKKRELSADYVAIVDVGIPAPDRPTITIGARGLLAMDVRFKGANVDLHSGIHGGLVFNPIHALVQVLGQLRDPKTGAITVPGFYDDIQEISSDEKKEINFTINEEEYRQVFGQKPTGGEVKYTPAERAGLRPTLEINGITGGFSGDGVKTVIPSVASAKISCRLVPNQDPEKISRLVAEYIKKLTPEGIDATVTLMPGKGLPLRTNPRSKIAEAFATAYSEIFNTSVENMAVGASIPITSELADVVEGEPVFVGLGLGTDNIHAPNEHFSLDRIKKGFLSILKVLFILGEENG